MNTRRSNMLREMTKARPSRPSPRAIQPYRIWAEMMALNLDADYNEFYGPLGDKGYPFNESGSDVDLAMFVELMILVLEDEGCADMGGRDPRHYEVLNG